ncbi:MAG: VWA domain-containing protein [Candidatus Thermoplasmatota archaeon]|nr:VWA domain-containing protein [Candidatus Thermoplasmatota archaeon]
MKDRVDAVAGRHRIGALMLIAALSLTLAASLIPLEGDGSDAYTGGGYLSPRVSKSVDAIWRAGSENDPENATITMTVSGTGTKGITLAPQDVVFLMDHSGSLETYDPQVLRILAAHEYVDNMIAPFDRAMVIGFDTLAWKVNSQSYLTSAYPQVHADLEALARRAPQGQTNYRAGVDLAIDMFDTYGNEENQRIVVMFTDGVPDPPEANVTVTQMDEMALKGIKLYTIGLGPLVDEPLLHWMANRTGGQFYRARTAEELVSIYMQISNQFYNYTAGANTTVELHLDDDFDYVMGSANVTDGFTSNFTGDRWILTWDVGEVRIGQNWSIKFMVQSGAGDGKIKVFTSESRVTSNSWLGENRTDRVPDLYLEVIRSLPPPLPPPPPPPPPVTPAPVPPPPSVPVVAPSVNVAPVITATPNVTPVTLGQTATVPVEYMLAGLAALGIAKRTSLRKKIIEKQKVGVGA